MWNNIDLLSNGKKYTVLTNGLEEWKHIYASVMILDEKENDVLTGRCQHKTVEIGESVEVIERRQNYRSKRGEAQFFRDFQIAAFGNGKW